MIGRSLVIFQRGNDRNEIHEVNSWEMALASKIDKEFNESIVKEAKEKKWKPDDVVSDEEVKKIVYATNLVGGEGYHQWASDCVRVINLSENPDLYNPATELAEQKRKKREKRKQSLEQLKQFIPELMELRKAVPTGSIEVEMWVPVKVKVEYNETNSLQYVDILDENGKSEHYASSIIDRNALSEMPELANIVNCPHRVAYLKRYKEVTELLKLNEEDIENIIWDILHKEKSYIMKYESDDIKATKII